ncbi:hypothetical protein [Lacticaseibacillus absianus]|uniref:hypothetical protein n=1 Tax=Lacticaseibacillus absianus TaxID=2729623 RepID=UPI0015CB3CBA|nr:hypothetical protein [Lacticaseibacillus absianus]
MNGHKRTTAQRKANRTRVATLAKQIQAPTSHEGQALRTYAHDVVEALTFFDSANADQDAFDDYLPDHLVYLSAESIVLSHQFYDDRVPSGLTAMGKVYQNGWAQAKPAVSAAAAFRENQTRWCYATQLQSRKQIQASARPLLTLFQLEDASRAAYDIKDVHVGQRKLTTPGLTLTFDRARRVGKDRLLVVYTVTNRTKRAYLALHLLNNFGVGFTQRTDQRVDQKLTTLPSTAGLTAAERKLVQRESRYLLPGQTSQAAVVVTGTVATAPVNYIVGGGRNRVLATWTLSD